MDTSDAVTQALELGRSARGMPAWHEAYEELKAREGDLPPEGLVYLAEAAWWIGHTDEARAAREAAYQGYIAAGRDKAAGRQALELARWYGNSGKPALSTTWFNRAFKHLDGATDCVEEGVLLYIQATNFFDSGEYGKSRELLEQSAVIADRYGDSALGARARMLQGMTEVQAGNTELGMDLLGEATTSVMLGDVDPNTAGIVMCNAISTCWDSADFRAAAEWTDSAERWFKSNDIPGYPGICRVRRAEIMTLRGRWDEAEEELLLAQDELEQYEVVGYIAEAKYALGEIQMYRGDIDGAVASFKEANQLGREPFPGFALVDASRGRRDAAIATLKQALNAPSERIERSKVLLPLVDLLIDAEDLEEAHRIGAELEDLAVECKTGAMRAWADTARAGLLAAEGSAAQALLALDNAHRIWEDLKVPYEAASVRLRRGVLRRQLGEEIGAELDFDAARTTFQQLGAGPDVERVNRLSSTDTTSGPKARAVMVTDIVGSTRLAGAMGDESWTQLLAWHDRTLVECIKEHFGETVDRTGDGYLVTFAEASAAVACAIEIQRALDRHRSDHGFAPSVRIGIHAADISDVDGSPAGAEVHRAARIGALAGADEILISRAVAGLLDVSITTDDWRSEEVKGFDRPVEVGRLPWRSS